MRGILSQMTKQAKATKKVKENENKVGGKGGNGVK